MENRNRYGFRDDDELIAVIVVLLLVALLAFYFIRGFNRSKVADTIEQPIAVVEDTAVVTDGAGEQTGNSAETNPNIQPATNNNNAVGLENSVDSAETVSPIVKQPTFAPTLSLAANKFLFGPVLFTGTGDPNTRVDLMVNDHKIGATAVGPDGNWSFVVPTGRLGVGDHTVVATADQFSSKPQTFTLAAPIAPILDDNWNNTVAPPNQYKISGKATPNWKVAIGVPDESDPTQQKLVYQEIPTSETGAWTAVVDLSDTTTYELEVFAVNPDGSVNKALSTGVQRIIITADGQPPAVAEQPVDEENTAAQTEADAAATEEADAAAQAEADATAQAEADAAAQAEADAAATAEAEAQSNLYAQLLATGQHSTLIAALDATGLRQTVEQSEQLTLFAPTDNAFGRLPDGVLDAFFADPALLQALLKEHIVEGVMMRGDISAETATVTNLSDHVLPLLAQDESFSVSGSNVTQADITASNGV
ncbi:MAG TPA: fasciclin domain-containing protein, partial [Anaerolineae bacterium]|nr:fasciclin domain-containing protein [Anaerolineae bacterium]